ncbi:VOC family protein [Sphingomonas sp. ID0503]|uniref:VOC family protein n=1 Tax=Sphingomonas sp. ID0503 TaxID=3399691 RepID=UPI003AFA7DD5
MTDKIRYKRLAYIALDVTDVAASADFYGRLVGLETISSNADEARLRCSGKTLDLMLRKGPTPGLRRVSFELTDTQQFATARERIAAAGLSVKDVPADEAASIGFEKGLRCAAPGSGLEVELITGLQEEGAFEPTVAKIARLGHVVMNVGDFPAVLKFWTETLNFAISDAVPNRIAFLRCFPNPLHHSLAVIAAPQDGYNHVNFMVSDIDDVGRGMNRMKKADVPIVFGPGRHEPSGSIFLYFLDPDGMTAEYSFGMEEFGEHDARDPRDLDPTPETLDTWGSVPDPRFAKTGALLASVDA